MTAATAVDGSPPVLEVRRVSKAFGHVQALRNVGLDLYAGEVVALIGDNGAGKSTLIKVLSGVYQADEGQILRDGVSADFSSPTDARAAGLATVYQDLALAESRDVAANIFLGREFLRHRILVDRRRGEQEAAKVLSRLSARIPSLRVPARELSGGQRQAVAIARALTQGANVVILDEPTAALGVPESERVLSITQELAAEGIAVLVVSHNLQHMFRVADRMVVLNRGEVVGVRATKDTSVDEVVRLITVGSAGS